MLQCSIVNLLVLRVNEQKEFEQIENFTHKSPSISKHTRSCLSSHVGVSGCAAPLCLCVDFFRVTVINSIAVRSHRGDKREALK